jgi:hypothetical protein
VNVGWLIFGFVFCRGRRGDGDPLVEPTAANRPNCLICLNKRL